MAVGSSTSLHRLILHQAVLLGDPLLFNVFKKLFLALLLLSHVLKPPILGLIIEIPGINMMNSWVS